MWTARDAICTGEAPDSDRVAVVRCVGAPGHARGGDEFAGGRQIPGLVLPSPVERRLQHVHSPLRPRQLHEHLTGSRMRLPSIRTSAFSSIPASCREVAGVPQIRVSESKHTILRPPRGFSRTGSRPPRSRRPRRCPDTPPPAPEVFDLATAAHARVISNTDAIHRQTDRRGAPAQLWWYSSICWRCSVDFPAETTSSAGVTV